MGRGVCGAAAWACGRSFVGIETRQAAFDDAVKLLVSRGAMAASERHTDEAGQNGSVAAWTRQAQEKTTAGSTTHTQGGGTGQAGPGPRGRLRNPGCELATSRQGRCNDVEGGQGPGC